MRRAPRASPKESSLELPQLHGALQAVAADARMSHTLDRGRSSNHLRMLAESYSSESMISVERDILLASIADATAGDASATGAAGPGGGHGGGAGTGAGGESVQALVERLVQVQRQIQHAAEEAEAASPERGRSSSRKASVVAPVVGQPSNGDEPTRLATCTCMSLSPPEAGGLSLSRSAPAGLLSAALAGQDQRRPKRKDAGKRLADRLAALDVEYHHALEASFVRKQPPRVPTPRREAVASSLKGVTAVDRERNDRGDGVRERRRKGREKLLREARELASRQLEQISLESWGAAPLSLLPTKGGGGGTGGGGSASTGALPRVLSVGVVRQGGGF